MAPSAPEQAAGGAGSGGQFGYWAIRGLGQSIRHVLRYIDVEYDERAYTFGEQLDSRDDWLQEKFTLGLDFPNLPYLKLGDVKLTQSLAILRFLARCGGLFPETEEGQQRVDVAEQQINDVMWECIRLCYNKEYNDTLMDEYLTTFLEKRCVDLEKFLGDRKFLAGDQLTYVDFLAWEMFDQHRTLWPEKEKMFSKLAKIENYLKRLEALPKFAKYLAASDDFKPWPVWSEAASHGGPRQKTPRPPVKY